MPKNSVWVEMLCQNPECGKTFKARACYVKRGQYKCCSVKCAAKMRSGKNNYNWKPKVKVSCAYCSKELERPPSMVRGRNYCNRECLWEHQKITLAGQNNPSWDGGKISCSCDNCGKEVLVTRYELDKYEMHFCDGACHGEWKSKNECGKNNKFYGKKHKPKSIAKSVSSRKELWESEDFRKKQSNTMKQKWQDEGYRKKQLPLISEVTSKRLIKQWQDEEYRERMTGENAPGWVHGNGYLPYPRKFNKALKEKIRNRDNWKCKICGKKETSGNRKLAVHHIDYNKNNNSSENLVSLCHSCHSKTNTNRDYWQEYFRRNKTPPGVVLV